MALGVFLIGTIIAAMVINTHQQSTTDNPDFKGKWDFIADPKLPNVLIIGDSISIGYTLPVRERLRGKANVYRPMANDKPANLGDTRVGILMIDEWLGAQKWDVIHFNWGLHDLQYINWQEEASDKRDKINGKISVTLAKYEQNMEELVTRLEATGATLIWASTTVVPEGEKSRFAGDEIKYNGVSERIMKKHGIATDDLYTLTKSFSGRFSEYPNSVHYTEIGSEKIAEQVAETIKQALPATSH